MKDRSLFAGIVGAIALSACASIPHGPPLTYQDLLPNTHENPVWARNQAASAPDSPQPPR